MYQEIVEAAKDFKESYYWIGGKKDAAQDLYDLIHENDLGQYTMDDCLKIVDKA